MTNPHTWRAISTVLLVVFVISLVVSGFKVPGWGWIALIASGVTFGIELALMALAGRSS
jgi:uncharacterized membrane protein